MNTQTSAHKQEETNKHNLRIKVLLEKLKTKLKNFSVLDNRGHLVGKVKNVHLDSSRQLNLVISEAELPGYRPFLLRSKHIQQVDYPSQSIVLDISKTEIQQLPQYKRSLTPTAEFPPIPTPEVNSYTKQMPTPENGDDRLESPEDSDIIPDSSTIVEEEVIRLLEERLLVNMNKRKVGEVIVRKEVETRMVEVPVQYERLIVEQVSPEIKTLAEIDLSSPEIPALKVEETVMAESQPIVRGEFTSPKAVSLLLDAIARQRSHGCQRIKIQIVLEDKEHQETYQDWFNRCAGT